MNQYFNLCPHYLSNTQSSRKGDYLAHFLPHIEDYRQCYRQIQRQIYCLISLSKHLIGLLDFRFLQAPLKIRLGVRSRIGEDLGGPFSLPDRIVQLYKGKVPFLEYSSRFRHQYALAYSELFLLRDDAVISGYLSATPLGQLRDPLKVARARQLCPDLDDPIEEIDKMSRLRALSFQAFYRAQGRNV